MTFPASSSRTGSSGSRLHEEPSRKPDFAADFRHISGPARRTSLTSCRPCAATVPSLRRLPHAPLTSRASRGKRAACPGRHETPGTHLGRPGRSRTTGGRPRHRPRRPEPSNRPSRLEGMKIRLLLAPLVAAALLAAAVIATPAAEAAAKGCSASKLVVWAGEEPGGGTAGSVYYRIEFTNLSSRTCTLFGFPIVGAVNLKGKQLGAPATHSPGKKVKAVKLAQGQTATAQLRIVEALNYSPNECKPTWAAGLRIGDPRRRRHQIRPAGLPDLRPDERPDPLGRRRHRQTERNRPGPRGAAQLRGVRGSRDHEAIDPPHPCPGAHRAARSRGRRRRRCPPTSGASSPTKRRTPKQAATLRAGGVESSACRSTGARCSQSRGDLPDWGSVDPFVRGRAPKPGSASSPSSSGRPAGRSTRKGSAAPGRRSACRCRPRPSAPPGVNSSASPSSATAPAAASGPKTRCCPHTRSASGRSGTRRTTSTSPPGRAPPSTASSWSTPTATCAAPTPAPGSSSAASSAAEGRRRQGRPRAGSSAPTSPPTSSNGCTSRRPACAASSSPSPSIPTPQPTRQLTPEIEELRAALKASRDPGRAIWLTELGWSSGHPSAANGHNKFEKGRQGQARELRGAFGLLRSKAAAWRVKRVYWFSFTD